MFEEVQRPIGMVSDFKRPEKEVEAGSYIAEFKRALHS
jgi:hypothetical protein